MMFSSKKSLIILILLILAISYIFLQNKTPSGILENLRQSSSEIVSQADDIPFKELTIPYLRQKNYDGKLNELEEYSGGSGYTSYLTSYNSDGNRINGLLTKPSGEVPVGGFPAIVFVHGYIPPSLYSTTGEAYTSYVDYFAKNGFVVFKIDLRGHGDSEGTAGGGYFGADYVSDILNAYNSLQNSDFVNPGKIGLWGHSMAGNAVMRSMAVKPEIPAGVIWAGAVYSYQDLLKYGLSDNSYRPPQDQMRRGNTRQRLYDQVGSPSATSDFWKKMAPIYFLNDLKGAIQIHHAQDDSVVNIGYSRDLIAHLNQTQVPHELFEYQSGGHNLEGSSFTSAMDRSVEFFNENLK